MTGPSSMCCSTVAGVRVTHLKVQDFFEDAGYWVLDFIVRGSAIVWPSIRAAIVALRTYLAQTVTAPNGSCRCFWQCHGASCESR